MIYHLLHMWPAVGLGGGGIAGLFVLIIARKIMRAVITAVVVAVLVVIGIKVLPSVVPCADQQHHFCLTR